MLPVPLENSADDMTQMTGIRREAPQDAGFLFFLSFVFFLPSLLTGQIPFFMDTVACFYPIRFHAANLLHSGQLPFWNRTMFCGVPLLANPQWGLLYPLNWPFFFHPGPFWFTVSYPLHFAIGACGIYLLVRKLGGNRAGGWAGALCFLLTTTTFSRIAFGAHHLALAWVPWGWLAIFFLDDARYWRKAILALALIILMQLMAGAPQVAFYALLSNVFFLFILPSESVVAHSALRRAAGYFVAAIIGLLLAAPQILPTLDFIRICQRAEGLSIERITQGALSLGDWRHAIFGSATLPEDPETTAFLGAAWAGLALSALLLRPRLLWPMAAMLVFFVVYAHPWPAAFLYHYTPLYASFHDPKRVLTIASIAFAVLAGVGFTTAFDMACERNRRVLLVLVAFALCLAAQFFSRSAPAADLPFADYMNLLGIRLPWSIWSVALPWRWIFAAVCALFLLALMRCAFDEEEASVVTTLAALSLTLLAYSFFSLDLKATPAGYLFDTARNGEFHREGRFFAFDTFGRYTYGRGIYSYDYPSLGRRLYPNAAAFYGLEDAQGYDAFKLKPYEDTIRAANRKSVLLYDSHFGLLTDPTSPVVTAMGVQWAMGPANSLFALSGPGQVDSRTIAPIQRLTETLDAPATVTLRVSLRQLNSSAFPELTLRYENNRSGVKIASKRLSAYSSDFGPSYGPRWMWNGAIPAGAGLPVITSNADMQVSRLTYTERTAQSESVFEPISDESYMFGFRIEEWRRYRQSQPWASVWPKAVIGDPFDERAMNANRRELIINSGQEMPNAQWPEGMGEGKVGETSIRANRLHLKLTAPKGGGWLLVRDAFAPGWNAKVDGKKTPILLAEGMFRALPLTEGPHTVEMRYTPPGLWLGVAGFIAGLLALGGLFIVRRRG